MGSNDYDQDDLDELDSFYGSSKKKSKRTEYQQQQKQKMIGYLIMGAITAGLFFYLIAQDMHFYAIGLVLLFVIVLVVIQAMTKSES